MSHKTYQLKDGTLEIYQDDSPENPREWNNNGLMVCFHPRYNLGDKHEFANLGAVREWMDQNPDEIVAVLPLYLYDHSGITMSTNPFSCPWDSGQVGWVIATRENLKAVGHDVDNLNVEEVKEWLAKEVAIYDQYLNGDVWGFVLRGPTKHCDGCGHDKEGDEIDSCFGFYGDNPLENGMAQHLGTKLAAELKTLI